MAAPTFKACGTVLRKTKLGETDNIVTMLSEDGSQIRGVAKGARKPGGAFAGRLELYNTANMLLSSGKGLPIIKEAKIVDSNPVFLKDVVRASAAAVVAELAEKVSQPDLPVKTLFPLTKAALKAVSEVSEGKESLMACAYMLKCFAVCGMRPSLDECVICGSHISDPSGEDVPEPMDAAMAFSCAEGGAICPDCSKGVPTDPISGYTVLWMRVLLNSTFGQISEFEPEKALVAEMAQTCQLWNQTHVGNRLKTLPFLLQVDTPI